jgi:enterochelin esterase-like enzyme
MKRHLPTAALFLAFVVARAVATSPLVSPEVSPDGRVTFRFADTGALEVKVSIGNVPKSIPLSRKDGVWSVTIPALPPETYRYTYFVDGQAELDPVNLAVVHSLVYLNSAFTIPAAAPQPWDEQDVPHGVLHHHRYTTHVAEGLPGNSSEYYVYTPPGYDPAAKEPYPVLYLLHGYSDYADDWFTQGNADWILERLIADKKAKPMVIVAPLGYGDMAILKDYDSHLDRNDELFERALVSEVMPQVEAAYNVSRDKDGRAIAGLSMGGDQSVRIGLAHPELFSSVGCFSGNSDFIAAAIKRGQYDAAKAALKVLWVGSGTGEGDDFVQTQSITASLRSRGFKVVGINEPGMHTWIVWHRDMVDFLPLLFR